MVHARITSHHTTQKNTTLPPPSPPHTHTTPPTHTHTLTLTLSHNPSINAPAPQVMTYAQAEAWRWNPFDLTKVWPHKVRGEGLGDGGMCDVMRLWAMGAWVVYFKK